MFLQTRPPIEIIHYACPSCQAIHASVDLLAGMTVICKACRHPIVVPRTSTAVPPAVETPALAARPVPPAAPKLVGAPIAEPELPPRRPLVLRWLLLVLAGVLLPTFVYFAWRYFISAKA